MTLAIADMPDDPAARARWLDEQLVGDRLADLAAELSGFLTEGPAVSIDGPAPHLAQVLERGTAALPVDVLQKLLRSPATLLALQERILLEGGSYWAALPRPGGLAIAAEHTRATIRARLSPVQARSTARPWRREAMRWASSFAVAAAVMIAFFATRDVNRPNVVVWGWSKPGTLSQSADAKSYYMALASGAREWYDQRPTDASTLATRLHELRQGCSTLILAEHLPLSAEQAKDLKERCRKWAAGFDTALASLEAGQDPLTVRTEVDAIVHKLVNYLETQSKSA